MSRYVYAHFSFLNVLRNPSIASKCRCSSAFTRRTDFPQAMPSRRTMVSKSRHILCLISQILLLLPPSPLLVSASGIGSRRPLAVQGPAAASPTDHELRPGLLVATVVAGARIAGSHTVSHVVVGKFAADGHRQWTHGSMFQDTPATQTDMLASYQARSLHGLQAVSLTSTAKAHVQNFNQQRLHQRRTLFSAAGSPNSDTRHKAVPVSITLQRSNQPAFAEATGAGRQRSLISCTSTSW